MALDPRFQALRQIQQGAGVAPPLAGQPFIQAPRGQIFSGGIVSDIVDLFSIPQFAVAGAIQGIQTGEGVLRGISEGVRGRTDFIDVLRTAMPEASPTTTAILGTAANILLDPLNLLPPVAIARRLGQAGRAVGRMAAEVAPDAARAITEGIQAVRTAPQAQRAIQSLDEFLAARAGIGIRPETRRIFQGIQQARGRAAVEVAQFLDRGRSIIERVARLDPQSQRFVARYIEAGLTEGIAPTRRPSAQLLTRFRQEVLDEAREVGIDPDLIRQLGDEWIAIDTELGRALVDAGVLTQRQFDRYQGQHLRRIFLRFEDQKRWIEELRKTDPAAAARAEAALESGRSLFMGRKEGRIPTAARAERQELTGDLRNFLGEIEEAAPRMARSLQVGVTGLRRGRILKELATQFGEDIGEAGLKPGYVRVPKDRGWGALAGKQVPALLFRELSQWERTPTAFERLVRRATSNWKFTRVVMNPAAIGRNLMSSFILADWGTGVSPFTRPDIWVQAAADLTRNTQLAQEARRVSPIFANTFVEAEFRQLGDELLRAAQQDGRGFVRALGRAWSRFRGGFEQAFDFTEKWGKMAIYRWARTERGMSPEEAARLAEEWLFNYANTPRLIENLSAWGIAPFIRWPYFAVPATAKALARNPGRVLRWFRAGEGIERATGQEGQVAAERRVLPEWMRNGAWLRLPIRDRYGRSLYLDLTYIIPFGDIGELAGVGTSGAQIPGLPGHVVNAIEHVFNMPFLTFVQDIMRNHNAFTGQPIWGEGDTPGQITRKVAGYIGQFLLPSWTPGGYTYRNLRAAIMKEPDWLGRTRSLNQAILSGFFGLKIRPVDFNEELTFRIREIQDKLAAVERNMRQVALQAAQGRVSEDYAREVWDEGLRLMDLLFRQYAALTSD